eukprot:scaffold268_cov134-Isochrysis_galbana.AAC.14
MSSTMGAASPPPPLRDRRAVVRECLAASREGAYGASSEKEAVATTPSPLRSSSRATAGRRVPAGMSTVNASSQTISALPSGTETAALKVGTVGAAPSANGRMLTAMHKSPSPAVRAAEPPVLILDSSRRDAGSWYAATARWVAALVATPRTKSP